MSLNLRTALQTLVSLSLLACFTGCSMQQTALTARVDGNFAGNVHGGQQPVSGAKIFLMSSNTSGGGNGSAAVSLITIGDGTDATLGKYVLSDAHGNFNIKGNFACNATSQVYALAMGGDPGLGTANAGIALMTALGQCNTLSASTSLIINEVTTVAAATAFAPFMTGPGNFGASATNAVGLNNAAAMAMTMVSSASGQAFGSAPSNPAGSMPYKRINALGNALATCVNSNGAVTGPTNPTACYTLYHYASDGTTIPTNTLTAMLNMAKNPSRNAASLLGLGAGVSPFQPVDATGTDLALPMFFATDNSDSAEPVAVDANGTMYHGSADATNSVNVFKAVNHLGQTIQTYQSIENRPDEFFVTNDALFGFSGNTFYLSAYRQDTGATLSSTGFIDGASDYPIALVTDATTNLSDNGGSLYVLGNSAKIGVLSPAAPFTAQKYVLPAGAPSFNQAIGYTALTSDGNIWVAQSTNSVSRVPTSAIASAATGDTVGTAVTANLAASSRIGNITVDKLGNIWLTQYATSGGAVHLSGWNSSNTALTASPFAVSGITNAYWVEPDNGGNLWLSSDHRIVAVSASSPTTTGTSIYNPNAFTQSCRPAQAGELVCSTAGGILVYPGVATPTAQPQLKSSHAAAP